MTDTYKPIACSLHDEYEIAIMHKKRIAIKWLDDAGVLHYVNVLPTDLLVANKEEYLLAQSQNAQPLRIRLDKITLLD